MVVKGAHLICDNGYHKVPAMICPMTFRANMKDVFWSEWVESVRKDVECTFGILKSRFRILKNPFQSHGLQTLEDVFFVCCMIHNILLIVDGGTTNWEAGAEYECTEEEENERDIQDEVAQDLAQSSLRNQTQYFQLVRLRILLNERLFSDAGQAAIIFPVSPIINPFCFLHSLCREQINSQH